VELNKDFAARKFDLRYAQRAAKVAPGHIPDHLDSIAVSLHQALDSWRYHNGDIADVALCLDAFVALWSVVEQREALVNS